MVAIGVGFGFVLAPMTSLAVACVPHAQAGLAGSANNAFRQIGAALDRPYWEPCSSVA